jgi:NitT/TauT family transport system permease protein
MVALPFFQRIWGDATAALKRTREVSWIDLLVLLGLAGLLYGLIELGRQWSGQQQTVVSIDASPWALPRYTFYSLCRGLIAYLFSLGFTLVYGYWAAKDKVAERVLIPVLDILQSIPVLGFLPGVYLALRGLFPNSNVGLELASVLLIFTGQAWNMTFSFYHSVQSVPLDQREVATIYRFSWWERFRWVELPFAMIGLVWNSMMSMAGGWFFLSACETYEAEEGFTLPGLGSYIKVAVKAHEYVHMLWAIFAMVLMIVLLDQLLWRPVVAWAQKFRTEEGGAQENVESWFLDWLRRSRLVAWVGGGLRRATVSWSRPVRKIQATVRPPSQPSRWAGWISLLVFLGLVLILIYGAWQLTVLLEQLPLARWGDMGSAAAATLGRVVLTTAIGTLLAVPAGLAIGLSPRLSRTLQPVVQVIASFPAPMLYPLCTVLFTWAGVSLNWYSIVLMLLGTQWYILFNVIAGAMAIPADLREAARSYRILGWQRLWALYLPAIFPYLVTGWVTAAGGAWNASILAEYIDPKVPGQIAWGLGALISKASDTKEYAELAAGVLVLSLLVVVFNRLVWRPCYQLAESRFSLSR